MLERKNDKMVKPGQRKFLLNMGMDEERINQMSTKTARNIIAQEEKRRAAEREKEYDKTFYDEILSVECIICDCPLYLHRYDIDDLSRHICDSCRDTILTMKERLKKEN